MKKFLLFAAALSVCTLMAAQKKAHWGVEVGYDHSWLSSTASAAGKSEVNKTNLNGFHVGPTMTYDFLTGHKHIPSISVGLLYQFMGSEYPLGMDKKTYKNFVKEAKAELEQAGGKSPHVSAGIYSHAIQIPVSARYTFRPNDKFDLFVYTGPMLNIYASRFAEECAYAFIDGKKNGAKEYKSLISNKETETVWVNGEKKVEDKTDSEGERTSRVGTLYWNIGIGATLNQRFSISLGFDECISNQSWLTKSGDVSYSLKDNFLKVSLGYTF